MKGILLVILPTVLAYLLSGCNRATPKAASEVFVDIACGREADKTFEDWSSWTKVNPTPLLSEGHADRGEARYVDVYVDDLAKTMYLEASAPYPECARIVKAKYTDETGEEIIRLSVMVKMPDGFDPNDNDWWYARYDASGAQELSMGSTLACKVCHRKASETDYLFSEEVRAVSNE